MNNALAAWILPLTSGLEVAIGDQELVYVMPEAGIMLPVPRAPRVALGVLDWDGQLVPVLDLARTLMPASPAVHRITALVALGRDSRRKAAAELGALALRDVPRRHEVPPEAQCSLPQALWPHCRYFSACFEREHLPPVPVLDLARWFGAVQAETADEPDAQDFSAVLLA